MKKFSANLLSKIFTYKNSARLVRYMAKTSHYLRLHKYDIFNKIPAEPGVIAFKHGFKIFGKVADFYLVGGVSPNKVRGIFYPGLFKNDFCKPFLKQWCVIPSNHLFHINKFLNPGESVAIALDGPEESSNQNGYLGAAWIAEKTGLPIIPLKIISRGGYTRIEVKNKILVPKNSDRKKLREITDIVLNEINH